MKSIGTVESQSAGLYKQTQKSQGNQNHSRRSTIAFWLCEPELNDVWVSLGFLQCSNHWRFNRRTSEYGPYHELNCTKIQVKSNQKVKTQEWRYTVTSMAVWPLHKPRSKKKRWNHTIQSVKLTIKRVSLKGTRAGDHFHIQESLNTPKNETFVIIYKP